MPRLAAAVDRAGVLTLARSQVECLRCGERRVAAGRDAGDCPRCGYVGWAPPSALDELMRRALRERSLELRRLRPVS